MRLTMDLLASGTVVALTVASVTVVSVSVFPQCEQVSDRNRRATPRFARFVHFDCHSIYHKNRYI